MMDAARVGLPPATTLTSDAELMRRTQQGDLAAFAKLVRRWQPPMGRFLGRLLGPGADPGDVCQELFLKMHQSCGRYVEQGNFSAWLYRLALNQARDAQRKRRRTPATAEEAMLAALPDAGDDDLARREEAELVGLAVAELPAPQREVIVLRHYEGLNFEAMGRLLGVPATTLKSRFAVALLKLKETLLARGYAPEGTEP